MIGSRSRRGANASRRNARLYVVLLLRLCLRHSPRLGNLADHRARIRAEDFAYLENRGETGDVAARLDDAEVLRVHAGALREFAKRPPASQTLAPQDRSEANGIRIGSSG